MIVWVISILSLLQYLSHLWFHYSSASFILLLKQGFHIKERTPSPPTQTSYYDGFIDLLANKTNLPHVVFNKIHLWTSALSIYSYLTLFIKDNDDVDADDDGDRLWLLETEGLEGSKHDFNCKLLQSFHASVMCKSRKGRQSFPSGLNSLINKWKDQMTSF